MWRYVDPFSYEFFDAVSQALQFKTMWFDDAEDIDYLSVPVTMWVTSVQHPDEIDYGGIELMAEDDTELPWLE